jgi:hypothetical protein
MNLKLPQPHDSRVIPLVAGAPQAEASALELTLRALHP